MNFFIMDINQRKKMYAYLFSYDEKLGNLEIFVKHVNKNVVKRKI